MIKEFKEFLMKGNLIDIAVAFVLGAAFSGVIGAFTGDGTPDKPGIVGSILAIIFGGNAQGFAGMGPTVNDTLIPIGSFVSALINFVLVGFVMFLVVKAYNKFRNQAPAEPSDEVKLLTEIRDGLRR